MKLIVALDSRWGIGKNNKLPWDHKCDLKYFSKITRGNGNNCVIMGNNTFKSIGKYLPGRKNLILSKSIHSDNINIFNNINDIYENLSVNDYDEVWIIGGLEIYNLFLNENVIDEIFITFIDFDYDCNMFFPKILENFIEDLSYTNSIYDKDIRLTYKKFIKLSK